MSNKISIGVLRGGISREHDVSMRSGATIINHLSPQAYHVFDIHITPQGLWMFQGDIITLEKLHTMVDVVFSTLHGQWGEDGQVQKLLEKYTIPYVGSDAKSSRNTFSKTTTKRHIAKHGIDTPRFITLKTPLRDYKQQAEMILRQFPHGCVIKANTEGSSFGIFVCFSMQEIRDALHDITTISDDLFVEEYITGREFTCGIFDGPRGCEALPIVEIIPDASRDFFDFDAKYNGKVREVCPAKLEDPVIEHTIKEIARRVHQVMHLRDYSRTDIIYQPDGRIVVLEVNTIPGMTTTSLFPQELTQAGYSLATFLDYTILQARHR